MKHVVVTEDIHADAKALLASRSDIRTSYLNGDTADLAAKLEGADGILVRAMALGESELIRAKALQVVSRHGVGCDNIAVEYLSGRNIPVAIAADSNTISVVEHTLMMMLALSKRAIEYDGHMRSRQWTERGRHNTSELHGKNILIVGFGRIGTRIAPVCKAFGMNVTVADIALDKDLADSMGCQGVTDFRPHLATSDYLTVHVPLDNSTTHLIGQKELETLPEHAIVINCARGGVIDEVALKNAIESGQIAATGSDVFTVEPVADDNPLLDMPNSILTPHNAAGTAESMRRMAVYAATNILDQFDGNLTSERIFNASDINLA